MEKIKILKTELASTGFNINIFVDTLLHIDKITNTDTSTLVNIDIDSINAWGSAELYETLIKDKQLFNFNAKDVFIIRQLLETGYFAIDQGDNQTQDDIYNVNTAALVSKPPHVESKNDSIKIQLDRIAFGTKHNIPSNKDIFVERIANIPYYNFHISPKLDDAHLKKLLTKSELLYNIELATSYTYSQSARPSSKSTNYTIASYQPTANPYTNVGLLNKYFSKYLYCDVTNSFDIFISRLYYGGLLEILRELINKKESAIEKFLYKNENVKASSRLKDSINTKLAERKNLFNRLVNIMKKSPKSYESILEKVSSLKITDNHTLMEVLSKTDREKIAKLIEVGLPKINNCSHNNDFQPFYTSRSKVEKYAILDQLKEKYVRADDHVFRCKKCDQFLYCEHTIEFDEAANSGLMLPSEIKNKLANKYRNYMINDVNGTVFCKYCGEKIHRYQNDEITDGSMFNAMSHARSLEAEGNTELPIVKNQSYIAVKKVLESFIFKYEYNKAALIKDIQNIILYHVLVDLGQLRIRMEDDSFENYAQLIAAIYTYIYMMNLYVRDPNIIFKDTRSGAKLTINEYASEFAKRILQSYRYVTNDVERVSTLIKNAYNTMKNETRSDISVITDKDIALHIINNPYYEFLYYMYGIEYSKTHSKPKPSEVDAFHHIVKVNPSKELFLLKSYSPSDALWKSGVYQFFANTYDMNLNFSSQYNNFQIELPNSGDLSYLPGYEAKKYDSLLLDQRRTMEFNRELITRKLKYCNSLFYGQIRSLFSLVPACMVFSDSLELYDWQPVIEKRVAVDYESGDIRLSKIKCDEIKSRSLMARLSPDKLTKTKGKFKIEKVIRTKQTEVIQRDIQFSVTKKIGQSFTINQLKFIGLSGGVTFVEFNKGNVLVPIQYELGALKLESYIKLFVARYNELKYNANRSDMLRFFEQAKMLNEIIKYQPSYFPDIKANEFLTKIKESNNYNDRYNRLQEYFVQTIDTLLNTNDPIFRLFVIEIVTYIFNIDRIYCISDGYIASTVDGAIDDEDAIGNNDQIEEVNEDDDGFIDQDNIDYEEDVDEEHDPN